MYEIDFKKLSGVSRLFLDFINFNESACRYYRYDFRNTNSYRLAAERIDKIPYQREKLALMLLEAASSFKASSRILANIEKLKSPDSLCVFAGQQVGLLLGPMYTVLKALTAYKLARKLENELDRPVIPCFWMASDDHDFDEIKTASLLNRDGECRKISYQPAVPPAGAPMADVKFDIGIEEFLLEIENVLIETGFKNDIKKLLHSFYEPGMPVSNAFTELFEKVLGEFGIVPVDPNFPGMKEYFGPIFKREITDHNVIFDIFESQSRDIIKYGYHRQVHKTADTLNLFYNDGIRRNININGDIFYIEGRPDGYSEDELLSLLESSYEKFSGNVTLRPIVQCYAFPTVTQIVGPSEAAYFAQIEPLFHYHGVPWPVIRPRLFATIIEPHIKKILTNLSIDFTGLANDLEYEVSRVIRENYPPELQRKAEELRENIEKPLTELGTSVKRHDPESFQAIEHTRRRIDHELNHLSKKLFQAHKQKHEEARNRVYKVASHLLPCGNFQERVLSPIYFMNKYGPDIFTWLERQLDIESVAHQLLEIDL
jgi:bacillithiol synthase